MLLRSTPALLLLFLPHSFVVSQSTYQYDDGALLFNRSAAPPGWRLARDSRPKRSDSFHGGLTIPLNHADGGAAVTNAVAQRSDPESALFQHVRVCKSLSLSLSAEADALPLMSTLCVPPAFLLAL